MISHNATDSKRSTPSLLARQIKLRLIPEDSSDSSTSNLVVSIHAIATFQALNDYLRPRLTGLLSTSAGSRLSGMLSALAAGRFGPDVLSAGGLAGLSSAFSAPPPPPQVQPQPRVDSGNDAVPKVERRRSQRLSAKASAASISENARAQASSSAATPSVASTSTVVAPHDKGKKTTSRSRKSSSGDRIDEDTLANDDEDDLDSEGDFMDADVDAEVNCPKFLGKGISSNVINSSSKVKANMSAARKRRRPLHFPSLTVRSSFTYEGSSF